MNIGQRLPMYISALGRCMAAHSGLSTGDLRMHFEALRCESKPSFEQYLEEVDRARKVGFAVDNCSFAKGVTAVSAAVLDENRLQ
jgi:DNA-binding IclR family transcriptional regulator